MLCRHVRSSPEAAYRSTTVGTHGSSCTIAMNFSGCSEVVSRSVRDRETEGSIPSTPTHASAGLHGAASQLVEAPWRTVHLVVMTLLHGVRGRCDSDVLYDFRL